MSEIESVYEKFKHLDKLLSDPEWCGTDARMTMLHELWIAVKAEVADIRQRRR